MCVGSCLCMGVYVCVSVSLCVCASVIVCVSMCAVCVSVCSSVFRFYMCLCVYLHVCVYERCMTVRVKLSNCLLSKLSNNFSIQFCTTTPLPLSYFKITMFSFCMQLTKYHISLKNGSLGISSLFFLSNIFC